MVHIKRKVNCDPHTFGGNQAGVILSNILNINDNPQVCSQVSNLFHKSTKVFKEIKKMKYYHLMMRLYYEHIIQAVDNHDNWTLIVQTLTKNCIHAQYKKNLK